MKESKKSVLNKIALIILFLAVATLALIFCSNNSFLYAKFNSCDQSWYITMGNGFIHGKIPYRDLYDHKGPVVYFVYAFISLITCSMGGGTRNAYYGALILEIITLTLFIYMCYKILNKYFDKLVSVLFAVISAFIVANSKYLNGGGGAVEEYFLPIFMWFAYVGIESIEGKKLSNIRAVLIGFYISVIFWSKYTVLIPIFAVFLVWFIYKMIKKEVKDTFISIAFMVLGFLFLTIFFLIFFASTNALGDLFSCYFYDNLFRYNSHTKIFKVFRFFSFTYAPFEVVLTLVMLILTIILAIKSKKRLGLYFLLVYLLSIMLTTKYSYYLLPITILTPFLCIAASKVLSIFGVDFNKIGNKLRERGIFKWLNIILIVLCVAMSSIACAFINRDRYVLAKDESALCQVVFAEKIKSYNLSSPTLLTYHLLDYGFYNALNIVPSERYFGLNNFSKESYPELYESMDSAVKEERVNFLILKELTYHENPEFFDENYTLLETYDEYTLMINTSLLESLNS